jgi:polyisoprenoid-binding protein YceI
MITKWNIDYDHSEVLFNVKYLLLTKITGSFKDYMIRAETEEDDICKSPFINFTALIDSIESGNEQRNLHLKSPDFFDIQHYNQLSFTSKSFTQVGSDWPKFPIAPYQKGYVLVGDLTIKNITKTVTLKVNYEGKVVNNTGRTIKGFTVNGTISRKDFGISWGEKTQAGKLVVGDEVEISCMIQMMKQEV